jgi:hypothetical protein
MPARHTNPDIAEGQDPPPGQSGKGGSSTGSCTTTLIAEGRPPAVKAERDSSTRVPVPLHLLLTHFGASPFTSQSALLSTSTSRGIETRDYADLD